MCNIAIFPATQKRVESVFSFSYDMIRRCTEKKTREKEELLPFHTVEMHMKF